MDLTKAAGAVSDLLAALDVDEGQHTADTATRVAAAWGEALAGYAVDPARHLERVFPAPPEAGLVIVSGIRVRSTCAHHLLPITGVATIGYRPAAGGPLVGLSKLPRVLHDYAARLQVQERLGWQVADLVASRLQAEGSACIITAAHGCMTLRGVDEPATVTTTYALGGEWTMRHPDLEATAAQHRAQGVPRG